MKDSKAKNVCVIFQVWPKAITKTFMGESCSLHRGLVHTQSTAASEGRWVKDSSPSQTWSYCICIPSPGGSVQGPLYLGSYAKALLKCFCQGLLRQRGLGGKPWRCFSPLTQYPVLLSLPCSSSPGLSTMAGKTLLFLAPSAMRHSPHLQWHMGEL